MSKSYKKGFTLIELIVVIAVIAILAGLIILRINQSSSEARNSSRKAQVHEISKAIDLFLAEGGSINWCTNACYTRIGLTTTNNSYFIPADVKYPSDYLSGGDYPKDPSGQVYEFSIRNDGTGKHLCIYSRYSLTGDPSVEPVCNQY